MTWDALGALLTAAHARGFRELYFTGGEPMLWRDGDRTLEDAVRLARRIGFFHVHLYTNGTLGLDSRRRTSSGSASTACPTRTGSRAATTSPRSRRRSARPATRPSRSSTSSTATTRHGIEPFLRWVRDTRAARSSASCSTSTRRTTATTSSSSTPRSARRSSTGCSPASARGLPVLNSRAGLLALQSGKWPRRTPVAAVADVDGESVCCRAPDWCCEDCGYAACTEIVEAQRLRPSAVLAMGRYW